HPGEMNTGDLMLSFNHYAYGAVVDWVYRTVAGIAPVADAPGYRRIRVAPRPAVGVEHASASIATALGEAAVSWRLADDMLELEVTVPFGAEAELDLPLGPDSTVEVCGAGADTRALRRGTHRVVVTRPMIADAARALAGSAV